MTAILPEPLTDRTAAPSARPGSRPSPTRVPLDSTALLAGGAELLIRHGQEIYRLRVTRQNRLILTK